MTKKNTPLPPLRHELRKIPAYRVFTPRHRIKLNQNESPVGLPASVRRTILSRLSKTEWNRYPDYPATRLEELIARRCGVRSDKVIIGHGSNELMYALVHATLEKGRSILLPSPSYPVAPLAGRLAGATVRTFPLGPRFEYDVGRTIDAIRRHTPRLIFLPSPNNPTGSVLDVDEVREIVRSTRSLVVVDEAYREFSGIDLVPLLKKHRNLVLMRTLSKAYRLAGLRIGYLIGDGELLSLVERAKPPHSIDIFAQIAGEVLFEQTDLIAKEIGRVIAARKSLAGQLAELPGVTVYRSGANFLLVRFPDGNGTDKKLLRKGILVRNVGSAPTAPARLRNCLRITVGSTAENKELMDTLRGPSRGT